MKRALLLLFISAYASASLVGFGLLWLWEHLLPPLGGVEGILIGCIVVVPTQIYLTWKLG